jgi:hypothetical protein
VLQRNIPTMGTKPALRTLAVILDKPADAEPA